MLDDDDGGNVGGGDGGVYTHGRNARQAGEFKRDYLKNTISAHRI